MLTDKQRRYAQLIAKGMEPLDAALGAGYAEHTAANTIEQLKENASVNEYIQMLRSNPGISPLDNPSPPPLPIQPPAPAVHVVPFEIPNSGGDPVKFLESVMDNVMVDLSKRMDAAKSLLPYKAPKVGDIGKKGALLNRANGASTGPFAPGAPPAQTQAKH